jgi:hypothetical protein
MERCWKSLHSNEPQFLDIGDVILFHKGCMEKKQEKAVLSDRGGLESAVNQPKQTYGGEFLYKNIRNHPFT